MSAPTRPHAVAFDVNETLFGLDRLGDAFEDAGLPGSALDLWFARTLADGFGLAAAGGFAPFPELAQERLRRVLTSFGRDPELAGDLLASLQELEPYEDVEPAFRRLRDAGITIVTLTNGSAELTRGLLRAHDLDGFVARCFDVTEVDAWKPRPEPYHHVASELGLEPEQVALVAVHSWDVDGARRAGLTTGWAARLETEPVSSTLGAHVTGASLVEVVDGLLAL